MQDSPYVFEATEANFDTVVLANSHQAPVLVDFWADWCGPCKMLMPLLDQLVNEYQGRFLLAKVDTEAQQSLAMSHGIRSIPTLKLFKDGREVEQLMGAQPEAVLRATIDRYITRESDLLRAQARESLSKGDTAGALSLLEQAQALEPDNYDIVLDRAAAQVAAGQPQAARELMQTLPLNVSEEPAAARLAAHLDFVEAAADAPPRDALESTVQENGSDLESRYRLGARYSLDGDYEHAMEQFLTIMQRDRKFRDDGGRRALLAVFDLAQGEDELVGRYRRRMSAALY